MPRNPDSSHPSRSVIPHPDSHPLLRQFWRYFRESRLTFSSLAGIVHLTPESVFRWNYVHSGNPPTTPSLVQLDRAAKAFGLTVRLVPIAFADEIDAETADYWRETRGAHTVKVDPECPANLNQTRPRSRIPSLK